MTVDDEASAIHGGEHIRGLLSLRDLSVDTIEKIVLRSLQFKKGIKSVRYFDKKMATLFFENSTRTQFSFIAAMINLGIVPVQINTSVSSLMKGENLYDTIKTLECIGYDGVIIRHSSDRYYDELAHGSLEIPIFNAGDGKAEHPTQTLLDLVTIYEEYGHFEDIKVCIVGDISHSRVAHGNAEIMKRLGMDVYISGPNEFMDNTASYIPLDEAVTISDIIMLLRVQYERHKEEMKISEAAYHINYGLTKSRAARMKDSAIIMHPAPVNRQIEIANEVVECTKSRIFAQMKNGVFTRMAVISMVLDGEL
ncbi:MAG: aspartate carbamoyltransferase catalytic subunit [Christensenellaceae bacterium]|jgi:aspartate carbamoyltransferase catalytic subunit|nr:aspartate carbamoyltransferase catalytic subunit [Christensenellaceae bacterium]